MNKITVNGEMDHLFVDDRDDRTEKFGPNERVPVYGANDLVPPKRALTADEIELANRVGTKKISDN